MNTINTRTIKRAFEIVGQTNQRIEELKAALRMLKAAAVAYSEDDGTYNSMTLYGAIEQAERVLNKDAALLPKDGTP